MEYKIPPEDDKNKSFGSYPKAIEASYKKLCALMKKDDATIQKNLESSSLARSKFGGILDVPVGIKGGKGKEEYFEWRLDTDPKKGPHINFEYGGSRGYHYYLQGTSDTVFQQYWKRLEQLAEKNGVAGVISLMQGKTSAI